MKGKLASGLCLQKNIRIYLLFLGHRYDTETEKYWSQQSQMITCDYSPKVNTKNQGP